MIEITDKSLCCGCSACQSVCPHDAISMEPDGLGFVYPIVDQDKCVRCGLCLEVCDFSKKHIGFQDEGFILPVSAVRNPDEEVLKSSQSGGVFSILSDLMLSGGGVVYGAVMDDDYSVCHIRATDSEDRDRMRGSKYVQSRLDGIFRDIKKDLESGLKVLFSGTPCQCAGLDSFLPEKLRENLLIVDFICHGVPSPAVWKDYVGYMGRKGRIVRASFRDKEAGGWKKHVESFLYEDGRKICAETFRVLFYKNIMLRHSCSSCPYHIQNRHSDITIGDFWGIGEFASDMDDEKGTSMLICHTDRGRDLVSRASLFSKDISLTAGFMKRKNPNLLRPTVMYKEREQFEVAYIRHGFRYIARRWGDLGWRYKAWKFKVFVKRLIGIE